MITLTTLFLDELADQYDAERRQVVVLPNMIKAATCTHLRKLLQTHLKETGRHVKTLEKVFGSFGERPRAKQREATIGFLNEGDKIIGGFKGAAAIDAGLISITQQTEDYKITSYGCLRDQAALLENREASGLLKEILIEKQAANHTLGELARSRNKGGASGDCAADKPRTDEQDGQPANRRRGIRLTGMGPASFTAMAC